MKRKLQFRLLTLLVLTLFVGLLLALARPFLQPQDHAWVSGLHGKSERHVIKVMGNPTREYQFNLHGELGEFRIELYNTYPPNIPNNLSVRIKELTWNDGDYFITVWLHEPKGKWVVLDTCVWHKDAQF